MAISNDLESASPAPSKPRFRHHALIPGFTNAPPFRTFLRKNSMDIGTQLVCLMTALLLYSYYPPILPRYFPYYPGIERSAWGVKYGQQLRDEYVNTWVMAAISYAFPAVVMGGLGLWVVRDFWDGNAALVGLGYALATSTLFINMIKIFIGGLRPHFLSVCKPIPVQHPATPNSVDWVTAEDVCTADTKDLYEVQMSFPSGHAYAAFAGFGFLSLWLNAKFKTFGPSRRSGFPHPPPSPDVNPAEVLARTSSAQEGSTQGLPKGLPEEKRSGGRIQHYKLVLFAAPWCIATLLAASKVRDGWHHPIDVIFGGLVGTLFAVWGFRMVYRGVWDQRVNHLVR